MHSGGKREQDVCQAGKGHLLSSAVGKVGGEGGSGRWSWGQWLLTFPRGWSRQAIRGPRVTQTLLGTTNGKGSSQVLLVHLGGHLYIVTIKDEQPLA